MINCDEASSLTATTNPLPAEVLRWVATAAPGLWFPSRQAAALNIPRTSLDEPLWLLRQAGLVQVADWVKDAGQGFTLTTAGEQAAADPTPSQALAPLLRSQLEELPRDPTASDTPQGNAIEAALNKPPPALVAPAIMIANIVWFIFAGVIAMRAGVSIYDYLKGNSPESSRTISATLFRVGALSGDYLLRHESWRLVSSCFVHIGLLHLLGNMLMLGILGPVAEALWGRWRFMVLYLLSGVVGATVAVALHPVHGTGADTRIVLHAGASGALWGVLSGMIVWLLANRSKMSPQVATDWIRRLSLILLICLLLSFVTINGMDVSVEAHLGGGVAGAILALALDRVRRGTRVRLLAGVLGVGFIIFAVPACLYAAERWLPAWAQLREKVQQQQQHRRNVLISVREAVSVCAEKSTLSAVLRTPKTIELARQRISHLRTQLAVADLLVWPDPAQASHSKTFLAAATAFADEVDTRLTGPPRDDDTAIISAVYDNVTKAWANLVSTSQK